MDNLRKVKLIKRATLVNSLGEPITSEETSREVYGVVGSSTQQEWFTAHRDGINSLFKLVIYSFEYEGELVVEMDGERYSVYRTYEASVDKVELYLEKKAGTENGSYN